MPPEQKIPNNSEIDQALKEFEAKSAPLQQAPAAQSSSLSDDVPRMVRWVMKLSGGSITEQRQAEYVLLGFTIIAIIISLFLIFGGGDKNVSPNSEIMNNTLNKTIEYPNIDK